MLAVGLLGGYILRPLVSPQSPASSASPKSTETSSPGVSANDQNQLSNPEELMAAVVAQTRHFKGDPEAPVTIIEFGDFQCPFCGRFATGAGRQIDEEYIQNGDVRFGYLHFAFLGPESQWAGEASECAAEQDTFWEYHDRLFDNQSGENRGAFNKDNLKRFAAELGFDQQSFDECLDSGKYASLEQEETQAAQTLGVRSTPSFLINGEPLVDAQPFDVFKQYIEAAMGK